LPVFERDAVLAAWEAGGTAEPSPAPAPAQAAPEPAEQRDKLEDAKAALRAELERRAAELGISADDLFSTAGQRAPAEQAVGKNGKRTRKPRDDTGAKRAAKYRGPNDEEWSGRGRTPNWLAALEAEGRGREEFLIGG
jgi:DNA-binding protein H-NS